MSTREIRTKLEAAKEALRKYGKQLETEPAPAQLREAFEEWYLLDTGFGPDSLVRDKHGDYVDPDAVSCWEGWRAGAAWVRTTRPEQPTMTVEPYGPIEKCPFCKHNASPNSLNSYVWVECDDDNCKARGPRISAPRDLNKRTPAYTEAVRIWNTTMQAMTSEKSPFPPGEK